LLLLFAIPHALGAEQAAVQNGSEQLAVEHALSLAFETPHTAWAKPYAGGKIRVLFFTSQYQGCTLTREIIELMQRFDLAAEAVYYRRQSKRLLGDGDPRWYGDPKAGTDRALRLLEKPFDAYFFNQMGPRDLPEDVRDRVVSAAEKGAGLVLVPVKDASVPETWSKLDTLPAFLRTGTCFAVGNGRAVVLPPREQLQYDLGWETRFDYQMAEQGRALLWAAGRIPTTTLKVTTPRNAVSSKHLPGQAITVAWQRATPGTRLRVTARRWDGHRLPLHSEDGLSAAGSVQVELPALRAGDYHLDAFLTSGRAVETWATARVAVRSDRGIAAVDLDKAWGEIGQTLSGKVRTAGTMHTRDSVRVRLMDRRGRVLVRQDFATDKGATIPFQFAVERWMPMLLRVEAVLRNTDQEVAAKHAFFRVTKRRQGQYNFVVWNYPSGDLSPYGIASMARQGVTAILQQGSPPLHLAAYEMAWVPYATSIVANTHSVTGMLDAHGSLKYGCYNDRDKIAVRIRETVERQRASRGHGVLAYSLGDENAVRASCLSPYCLKAYRDYLQGIYENIDALNEEWGSDFDGFDQVTLSHGAALPAPDAPKWFKTYYHERREKHRTDTDKLTEKQIDDGDENDEVRALQAENYARWYDRQAFQCYNYVQLCMRFARAFKKIDPRALTGFEGTDSFSIRRHTTRTRQGGDVDLFVRELEYFGPYSGPGNELVRSIAPRNFPCGNWIGYARDADTLLQKYWDQITNGMNMVQWWRWDALEEYHGFLSPNLSPYPATRELLDDTKIVRGGLGTLLMRSDMQDDGIAMLYSLPSTYIAHFDGNRAYGKYKTNHRKWFKLIHDAGLQFRYVTDRMLRRGEFDASRYKVLILPFALAVGKKEATVIRDFVRQGGTLIADVRAGIYDGHCKPLGVGRLDDVFGIKREGRQDAVFIDRIGVSGNVASQPLDMRWGNWHGKEIYPRMKVDPAVNVTAGKALGKGFYYHYWNAGAPTGIVNAFGRGRAILLNFSLDHAPISSLIKDLLAAAGAKPEIVLHGPDGGAVEDVEITRWRNGGIELVALFGSYDGEVQVTLPEEKYVYDFKKPAAFGKVKRFWTRVRPHRAGFYALLSRDASVARVTLATPGGARGSAITATLSVPDATGLHALRLRLAGPDGRPVEWLDRVVLVDKDPVEVELPFAFNDPAGAWTVSTDDLYTNHVVSAPLTIE